MRQETIRLEWEGKGLDPSYSAARLKQIREVHPSGDSACSPSPPQNRLILGDNLSVMKSLGSDMQGSFRMIYADPPFATGKGFARRIGRGEDSRKPATWKLGEGYSDTWETMEQYLSMLFPRLVAMRDLLADDGTLYLHLDWRATHHARLLLDEIFGPDHFVNEIIWIYHGPSPVRSYFNRKHDTILVYSKGKKNLFFSDRIRVPYNPVTRRTFQSSSKAGFGKQPDLNRGKVPEDWWYFPVVARLHNERTGYPTQKPESLLSRILLASSDKGDWIGDFFCGSGTTLQVADSLARRWVGCDILPQSIAICQRRFALGQATSYHVEVSEPQAQSQRWSSKLKVRMQKEGLRVYLQLESMKPCRPEGFPRSLDFWEVDFDYSGDILRSTFQTARPWRDGAIETSVSHSYARAGNYRILIRTVSTQGDIAEKEIGVTLR